jgi:hypothetical protein
MFAVKVSQSLETLVDNILDNVFGEGLIEAGIKDVRKAACIQILNEDPKAILEVITVMVLYNVLVIAYGH